MNSKKRNQRIVLAAWLGLFFFITIFLLTSAFVNTAYAEPVRDVFYFIMGVVTVTVLIVAAVKSRGHDKKVWILIASAGALWAIGDLSLRICELTGMFGPKRVFCVPDIFYLTSYVFLVALVVSLGRATEKPGLRFKWVKFYPFAVIVVSIIISVVMAIFLPHGVAASIVRTPGVDFSLFVNYLYTALDVCVVAGLSVIILVHRTHFNRLWEALLVLGLSVFTIADLSYSLFKPAGIYDPVNLPTQIIIAMWLGAYGLLSMAAVYKLTENTELIST
ncbi:MAG: hypothetical protein WC891_04195 [Actinomycetota bacterium]